MENANGADWQEELYQKSENLAKSRLMIRRSDHGPWSVSVDRDFPYPASDTNYGRPAQTVIQSMVRRSDRR
ncbi:hypothetical protein MTR67_017373 [Solanum verrucosum]|uniref:Uncharacterized protein n=1 Tax=Solanum verrucosum TaxID=315347 RepID=A0AAF0QKA7_SOLVR|nr:hypothetical protein MTR67_017373 [Solanum verrucosum]